MAHCVPERALDGGESNRSQTSLAHSVPGVLNPRPEHELQVAPPLRAVVAEGALHLLERATRESFEASAFQSSSEARCCCPD